MGVVGFFDILGQGGDTRLQKVVRFRLVGFWVVV